MPNLTWIGKEAVVRHHLDVPFRLLKADPILSFGDPESGNLIVQGDNLVALKALLPYYAGTVKCIYIDPPYNTGEQTWTYNDAVNSPEIRDWLGKTVGKEAEDLCRHEKWLCMMYPRLRLLKDFLRDDGVIFVSIDDEEVRHLHLLMDEIFGVRNALGTLVWKRRSSSAMRGMPLSIDHEYVLVYAKEAARKVRELRAGKSNAEPALPAPSPSLGCFGVVGVEASGSGQVREPALLALRENAGQGGVVFLWVASGGLDDAIDALKARGFRYAPSAA